MDRQTALQLVVFMQRFENEKPLYVLQQEPLTMMPYQYNAAINDFIQFCYDSELIKTDYHDKLGDFENNLKQPENWFDTLTERQVVQCIASIVRRDRLVDGLINNMIENGTIIELLNRLKVLHNL